MQTKDDSPMAVGSTQPTGAQKHDDGKPAMELIDAEAMADLARVLEFGRRKYGAHNWRGGIGIGRLIGAALRHTFAFMRGEDTDPESGLPHLAHAMCSIMFAMWTVRHHPGLDDRWKATNEPREAKHYE
jgi:hypothetical protein